MDAHLTDVIHSSSPKCHLERALKLYRVNTQNALKTNFQGSKVTVMLFSKSSIQYNKWRPAPSLLTFILVLAYAFLLSGCSRMNPLSGYDFADATLVVEAPVAPLPAIVTHTEQDILGVFEGSFESIFTATTAVVKESKVAKARRRIKRAAEKTDVSLLIADGILERSERYLNFVPAREGEAPDLVMVLHINKHGIYSGPAYDGRTEFFLDAHVSLFDDYTGDELWDKEINISEPISDHFFFSNIKSSNDVAGMSEEEMVEALERISDYTADATVRVLRREIARANR